MNQHEIKKVYLSFIIVLLACFSASSQQTLWVGQSYTFDVGSSVIGLPANMQWSTNGGYLSLSGSGYYRTITVTQYFEGTATVTCEWDYKLYSGGSYQHTRRDVRITCRNNQVYISPTSLTLAPGETGWVSYHHQYDNEYTYAANPYFQSTNPSVCTVSSNGEVIAKSPGTAYINVYSKISSGAPYCKVTVEKVDPTSVSLPNSQQVYVGETSTLVPTVYPSKAQTTFTWYSRNSGIASVSSGGVVTGVSEGETSVYAVSSNGLQTNDCRISVNYRRPSSVSVTPSTLNLPISQKSTLKATVSPTNSKYELSWDVTPRGIVEISNSGEVTALKAGTAVVTATTDNGCKGSCTVTVPPNPSGISLPKKIALGWNKSRKLECTLSPADASRILEWSSSNPEVATVTSDGNVTAVAPGQADIKVRTHNGKEAVCRVEVDRPEYQFNVWLRNNEENIVFDLEEHPVVRYSEGKLHLDTKKQSLELDMASVRKFTIKNLTVDRLPTQINIPETIELYFKNSKKIEVDLLPADYDIQTRLTWNSDSPDIVEVSHEGIIKANSPGEANVSVTAANGCTASCLVTVPVPDYHLFVWLTDGRYDRYSFGDKPKITYEDGEIVVCTHSGECRYSNEVVHKITLSDNESPDPIKVPEITMKEMEDKDSMTRDGDSVLMQGMTPGSLLHIYSLNGQLIRILTASEEGTISFTLSDLSAGVYILKTETITYKIIKR